MNFKELLQKMSTLDQPVAETAPPMPSDDIVDMEGIEQEGNEFSGALAAAKASGQSEFEVDGKRYQVKEDGTVEECGMMSPMGSSLPPPVPKQADSVTMNVSMNGSGAGGIKDLLNVLRNIEGGGDDMPGEFGDADADVIFKKMEKPMSLGDAVANEPDEMYQGIDAVTRTGGDLHSKGIERPAVAGGGNPLAMESLKERLQAHYNKIKES